ncbi:MAG: amino acid adenylation domain-containing protein [Myxococcota bacterium]
MAPDDVDPRSDRAAHRDGASRIDRADARSLRSGFLRAAERHASRVALVARDDAVSYGELASDARRIAHAIVDRLGRAPARVGVFAHRSRTGYTGTLAALFAGAAFVPLNRTFPVERTRRMAALAELDAIVVDAASAPQLGDVLAGVAGRAPLLVFPDAGSDLAAPEGAPRVAADELARAGELRDLPPVVPTDVAYLLFTSGTTGTPKGVPVTHANALHFLDVMSARYALGPDDRLSQTFDATFDLSVFDQFMAWEAGARLCAMQSLDLLAPSRFARKHELTVWFSVPSVPALMRRKGLLAPDAFPTLRWSLFCGEPLPRETAEAWQAAAPASTLENLYGPTELTIACFVHRWDAGASPALCANGVVPIGRPYPGLGAVVLGEGDAPVADGEDGELCVCGPQTVPGYWRDAAKTAERFVELPFAPGVRFYRTGDRVRRLANGEYVHLGRVDHQVKVLGHRVELGEIEAVLRSAAGVVDAVAVGWPVAHGSADGIVAFVTASERGVDADALVAHARTALPEYMVPGRVVAVDAMPLNANGKIDRAALVARLDPGAGA